MHQELQSRLAGYCKDVMQLFEGVAEFIAVAEGGSFVRAAERLGMTKSGVGKAVNRLETRLGVRLLNRTTRALSLTDDGRALFDRGRQIVSEMQEVEDQLGASGGMVRGLLTVNVAVSLGHLVLIPSLPQLLDAYPELALDVRLSDRNVDLADEGVDVALRFGDLPDSGMVARRLGRMDFCTFASPGYLERNGTPQAISDIDAHNCIAVRFGDGRFYDWQFEVGSKVSVHPVRGRMTVSSGEAALAAATAGAGIAQLYAYMPQAGIEAGSLVPVLTEFNRAPRTVSVVYPTHRHLSAKVAAFVKHCVQLFGPLAT